MKYTLLAVLSFALLFNACTSNGAGELTVAEYEPITTEDLASDEMMLALFDETTDEIFSLQEGYLTFGFPSSAGWKFNGYTEEGATRISVPDDNYEVFLDIKATRLAEFQEVDPDYEQVTLQSGAVLYRIPFGGGFDLAYLNFGDTSCEISVSVSSSEPVPENPDGIWSPSTQVTQEELWLMYQTGQLWTL